MNGLHKRFLAGKMEIGNFTYVGFGIEATTNGVIIDQSDYVSDLETYTLPASRALMKNDPLTSEEHTALRAMVGRLNWAVQGE